ncbi:MAG: phosphoribosylamine--glycine ligase [bacterium]|nr:phosphoribosylamine--glycine ligase [bacterium]
MKVLFVSGELIAGDLAYCLKREGCDVKLFIEHPDQKHCLDGFVDKTDDWKKELDWVGKDGLIIFDDVGYGKIQDDLRKERYLVVGGSGDGDKLELDREYGQKILKLSGVRGDSEFDTKPFTIDSAIDFVKNHRGEWVIKQDDHNTSLNYVGTIADGSDVIGMLENYKANFGGSHYITLQKRVHGVEIAVGRFFNGKNWIGPSVINIEHKHLCNDDVGPLGGETGTLMWYEEDNNNKLFQKTLAKLKPQLQKSGYKGYVDVNCIVSNEDTIYPLEITSRFGSSTNQMQREIHISLWSEFLIAIARGEDYPLQYKKNGYGIAVVLTVAPFPYRTSDKSLNQIGTNVFFKKELSKEEFTHISFEGISVKRANEKEVYCIEGNLGYALYVTGFDETVEEARERVYSIIDKIIIPKAFYRTDIGLRFVKKDRKLLEEWGWI